jgi:hypothetical protein
MYRQKCNLDYEFGIQKEKSVLNKLRDKFGESLQITDYRFAAFDFFNETTYIELKSRRCSKNCYLTTMISYNKVLNAKQLKIDVPDCKDIIFCFQFTDKLCYWKFNEEELEKMQVRNAGRMDRGRVEHKLHLFIPIEYLIDVIET